MREPQNSPGEGAFGGRGLAQGQPLRILCNWARHMQDGQSKAVCFRRVVSVCLVGQREREQ